MSPSRLDDDELEARLDDWAAYVRAENGDVDPAAWQKIDALLDELGRRLGLTPAP